jgi:hypothetical protein
MSSASNSGKEEKNPEKTLRLMLFSQRLKIKTNLPVYPVRKRVV